MSPRLFYGQDLAGILLGWVFRRQFWVFAADADGYDLGMGGPANGHEIVMGRGPDVVRWAVGVGRCFSCCLEILEICLFALEYPFVKLPYTRY